MGRNAIGDKQMTNLEKTSYNRFSENGFSLDYPVQLIHINSTNNPYLKERYHWHDEIEIIKINSGNLHITLENTEFDLTAGNAMAIMPGHVHNFDPVSTASCSYDIFIFHPTFLFGFDKTFLNAKYLAPIVASKDKYYYCLDGSENWHSQSIEYIKEAIRLNDEKMYGYELRTKGVLCELWGLFLGQISLSDRTLPKTQPILPNNRVRNAIVYIEDHYTEGVTLEEIADSIHVSKSECCRSFKRSLNMTPFEYLMKYRIYIAASKIASNDPSANSISALAASIGFNNTSYFNKVFKEFLGCTPTQYRKDLSSYDITKLLPNVN